MKIHGVIVVFVVVFIFSSCSNLGNSSSLEPQINLLNNMQNDIIDSNNTHDKRVEMSLEYIEILMKFLEAKESTLLNNDELEEALNNNIVVKTKQKDDRTIRIIRYDGLSELFGTLERKWTIIQWWDEQGLFVQILNVQGAENVEDIVIVDKDNDTIMLSGGYLTSHKPFPLFLSLWKLIDNQWIPTNNFDISIERDTGIQLFGNMLIIDNNIEQFIETNQQENGFVISSKNDTNEHFEFIIKDDKVFLQQ